MTLLVQSTRHVAHCSSQTLCSIINVASTYSSCQNAQWRFVTLVGVSLSCKHYVDHSPSFRMAHDQ